MIKSPYEKLDGIVYFPRMLQKIRLHANGQLPEEYIDYLGVGFDGRCVNFLGVDYHAVKELVLQGCSDEEMVQWCKENGVKRTNQEKLEWNEFMVNRGHTESPQSNDDFQQYKQKYGLGHRDDIKTYFEFFEVDEGRAK